MNQRTLIGILTGTVEIVWFPIGFALGLLFAVTFFFAFAIEKFVTRDVVNVFFTLGYALDESVDVAIIVTLLPVAIVFPEKFRHRI